MESQNQVRQPVLDTKMNCRHIEIYTSEIHKLISNFHDLLVSSMHISNIGKAGSQTSTMNSGAGSLYEKIIIGKSDNQTP